MAIQMQKLGSDNAGLAWKFHVSPDSCNHPEHYDNFIRFCAMDDQNSGRGVTHLLIDTGKSEKVSADARIIGYITLRAASLVSSCEGVMYADPALEIAELAVDQEFEHKGWGKKLVDMAILLAYQLNQRAVGIQSVVLCADPRAVGFYENEKVGFGRLEDYYEIPRDGWNNNCIPMYIKLSELGSKS